MPTWATLASLRHDQVMMCDDSGSGGGRLNSFKLAGLLHQQPLGAVTSPFISELLTPHQGLS